MQRELTITVTEELYEGLQRTVGSGSISRFIEELVRPHVVLDDELAAAYREAAADLIREQEALEWIEADVDGALE